MQDNIKQENIKAGIIGLGLMGGSLGLELRDLDIFSSVVGYDTNKEHQNIAIAKGLVEECVDFKEILKCDIILLSAPVDAISDFFKNLHFISPKTTIIEISGTKTHIAKSIKKEHRNNTILAHPMCGIEDFGPKAAHKGLYKGNIVIFADTLNSAQTHINIAKKLFSHLGMSIMEMSVDEHDEHVAFISHMPHIISYAIANTVLTQQKKEDILALAAGGFRSMSRLAKSSPKMWSSISKQNKDNLLKSINIFENELKNAKNFIEQNQWERLQGWLSKGKMLYDIF